MKKRVYIETTVLGYLTSKPSRDLLLRAHQAVTRQWWDQYRPEFDLYVSQFVLDEVAKGDTEAAERRTLAARGIPLLPVTDAAIVLADALMGSGHLPERAGTDALHIAVGTVHRVDFLLTWNCRHLANARILAEIGPFARTIGYELLYVCTPEELMGGEDD